VRDIRLFGSWARNEARIDSDIDVAVLVDRKNLATMKTVSEIASDLSLASDHFLSAVVIESESHQRGKREGYPFHLQIEREGISL
jgi:predicted nucleotidyltransferase